MAEKLTITEALAELKTMDKRLTRKREFIQQYIARQDIVKDPLEKDGGSVTAIQRERQSMKDLEERKIAIRRSIAAKNMEIGLSLGGQTRSMADWLVWRREVAPAAQQFLVGLRAAVKAVREEFTRKGGGVVQPGEGKGQNDVVVNVSELKLAEEIEALEEILGALDGQLSLKNATTFVEF